MTEVHEAESHNEHEENLYRDEFDPKRSSQGDLDLLGLGKDVDRSQEELRTLKASLEDWRVVLPPILHFLRWEQMWYPGAIVGANTFFFLLVWYLNLSILSTVSILATLIALADAVVPIVATSVLDQSAWTAQQETEYDTICQHLLTWKHGASSLIGRLQQLRAQYPRVFSVAMCAVFLFAAIVFDRVNNFILVYLFSTLLLLSPGLAAKNVYDLAYSHSKTLIQTIKDKRTKKQA